jgi:hypothetical protein
MNTAIIENNTKACSDWKNITVFLTEKRPGWTGDWTGNCWVDINSEIKPQIDRHIRLLETQRAKRGILANISFHGYWYTDNKGIVQSF